MIVLDSSCWVEFLQGTDLGDQYSDAIDAPADLRVPAITIYEVYRFVLREGGETLAIQAAGMMSRSLIVDLDATIAMQSATIGNQHQIPLADSIIYATAQSLGAEIWTQDVDLDGLPGVRYFKKPETT